MLTSCAKFNVEFKVLASQNFFENFLYRVFIQKQDAQPWTDCNSEGCSHKL